MGIYRIKQPEWILKDVLHLYPRWPDRTPQNTPDHVHGYSPGGRALTYTGGIASCGINKVQLHGNSTPVWHPAWRLYEKRLPPGWTWRMNDLVCDEWSEFGVFASPKLFGVPESLWEMCSMSPLNAESLIAEDHILSSIAYPTNQRAAS